MRETSKLVAIIFVSVFFVKNDNAGRFLFLSQDKKPYFLRICLHYNKM